MKIIALDDERLALANISKRIKEVLPDAEVYEFTNPLEMLGSVEKGLSAEIAFLDIEMSAINGIECAKRLRLLNNNINIVFTTAYTEYALNAFGLHASGYVLKPITAEKIRVEIDNLRTPVTQSVQKRLAVKTFGNFEVFVGDEPLRFRYSKTKELLAYLVDRCGSLASNAEIIVQLWEDDGSKGRNSYLRNLKSDLMEVLREYGLEDCVVTRRGNIGIVPDKTDCDFYRWLNGEPSAINSYNGEYMSQYSWAETTHAGIESNSIKRKI